MDIQEVISGLKAKFGDGIDTAKIAELFKNVDLKNFHMDEIVEKVKGAGLLGDLDGDGVKEGFFDELKGKVSHMFSH